MSQVAFKADIVRDAITETAGGGETAVPGAIYSGLSVTVNYRHARDVDRYESGSGKSDGPGALTRSRRVIFLDPWSGAQVILVGDRVAPNPAKAELPSAFKVIGVRPYEAMLQLDVEDVSTSTAVT